MAVRYWRGGSGNWADTSHWATTSGGAGGASVPGSSDDVIFDANSFSVNDSIIYTSTAAHTDMGSITFSGITKTVKIENNSTYWMRVYGEITLSPLVTLDVAALMMGATGDFNQAGATLLTVDLRLTSGFIGLASTVNLGGGSLIISSADLETYDYSVTAAVLSMGSTASAFFGSSDIYVTNLAVNSSAFLDTESSTLYLSSGGAVRQFQGGNQEYNKVVFSGTTWPILDTNTFTTLEFQPGATITVTTGGSSATTLLVTTLIANGTSSAPITIKSSSVGLQHVIRKTSGTVNATYLNLQDSIANGGATFNTSGGINNGNNSGWNFLAAPIPTWGYIASAATVYQPALVPGAGTMRPGFIASKASVYNLTNTMRISGVGSLATSSSQVYAPTITALPPPPPPPTDWEAIGKEDEKVYVYKVYKSDGTFIGIWTDVRDDLMFTRKINTPGTTTTVRLSRSPNTTKEVRASLTTEAGEPITAEDGERLTVTYETNNSVGEGTDVDINYKVDVYVHYGEFERLVSEAGESLTTEEADYLLAASGAPSGVRVFSGTILDYQSTYGEQTGVTVTLASHGLALSNELVRSGEITTVNYSSQALQTTLKSVLDTNPQVMTYSTDSIATPGISAAFKFELTTKLEAIERIHEQTPDGWYWSGDVADNFVYLQPTATTAHHIFKKGYHVKELDLTRSKEQLINRVYFIGGEVGGVPVFKKYEDAASIAQWGVGLHRIVDRRFTDPAAMERKAMKLINRFKNPIYTTPITISSARYDLESIKEGQLIGFANYGNFVDELLLQIVSLSYSPTAVQLEVGDVLQAQHERIEEISDELQGEQYQNLPTAPV